MPVLYGDDQNVVQNRAPVLAVYVKQNWGDEWIAAPYIDVLKYTFCLGPQISQAELLYHYGSIKRVDTTTINQYSPQQLQDWYILISQYTDEGATTDGSEIEDWIGVITSEQFAEDKKADIPAGSQGMIAYGLEILLDRCMIKSVRYFKQNPNYAGSPETYYPLYAADVDILPTINNQTDNGQSLIGNFGYAPLVTLTDTVVSDDLETNVYGIAHPDDGAFTANLMHVVDYLLEHDGPKYSIWSDGWGYEYYQMFYIGGLWEILTAHEDVFPLREVSVWQMLKTLLDRRKNIAFRVVASSEPASPVMLEIYPVSDITITVGDTKYDGNFNVVSINPTDYVELQSPEINFLTNVKYDRITVRGAPIKVMSSFSQQDGTLEAAWSAGELAQYVAGVKGLDLNNDGVLDATDITVYDALTDDEKTERNDAYRATSRFDRVGRLFRLPRSWTGYTGDGRARDISNRLPDDPEYDAENKIQDNALPLCKADGTLDYVSQATQPDFARGFLHQLIVQEGIDYGVISLENEVFTPVDRNPDDAEPPFLKPFVLFGVPNATVEWTAASITIDTVFVPSDKLQENGLTDYKNVGMVIRDREQSIELRTPQSQMMLLSEFVDNEPTAYDYSALSNGAFDWRKMILTAVIETGQRLYVQENVSERDVLRELVVTIPHCELWYITEHCVMGVNHYGGLIYNRTEGNTGRIVRDDSERLRTTAKLLKLWYGRPRATAKLTFVGLDTYIRPGVILKTVTNCGVAQEINTIVSKVTHSFSGNAPKTVIETSYDDISSLITFGVETWGIPDVRTVAQLTARHEQQITELKQRTADVPDKYPVGGGAGEWSPTTIVCKLVSHGDDALTCVKWNGLVEGETITVYKPYRLQRTPFDGVTDENGITYTYSNAYTRECDNGVDDPWTETIYEPYSVGDIISAQLHHVANLGMAYACYDSDTKELIEDCAKACCDDGGNIWKIIDVPFYDAGTTYAKNDVVYYDGNYWASRVNSNLNHTPAAGAYWAAATQLESSYYKSVSDPRVWAQECES